MVSVKDHSRTLTGRFVGLDATGRLIVETGTELITIDAGDVFLHGARAP
jgi:biotin-(acetyl-CoA carboxylase) ligase